MATIWDADVLIWAASQIVHARDAGLKTSRLMAATPYEILTFVGRGASARDYSASKPRSTGCSRRQSRPRSGSRPSVVATASPGSTNGRRSQTLRPCRLGIELILPDWFYVGVLENALVLTIDRAYFTLTGGIERWLYRLVRKHGGRQEHGWSFDFDYLHAKSGSLSPIKHFAYDLRDIVRRQPLPGYSLTIGRTASGSGGSIQAATCRSAGAAQAPLRRA